MTNIYDQHDKAFQSVSAYVITTKGGKPIGKVAFRNGNRVTCFMHVGGTRMSKGWADGGGYDRASAAAESAAMHINESGAWPQHKAHVGRIKRALSGDSGYSWDRRLQDAGYQVLQAV